MKLCGMPNAQIHCTTNGYAGIASQRKKSQTQRRTRKRLVRVRNMGKRLVRVREHIMHHHPHSGAHLGAAMNKKDQAGKDTDKKNGQIVVPTGAVKAGTSIKDEEVVTFYI